MSRETGWSGSLSKRLRKRLIHVRIENDQEESA